MGSLFTSILLLVFLSILHFPRVRLYYHGLSLLVGSVIGGLFGFGQLLRPVLSLLKVDMQSKLVSGVILISTSAPRIGAYVLSRDLGFGRVKRVFNSNVGNEMLSFRRDLRRMYIDEIDSTEGFSSRPEMLSDIKSVRMRIRRRHTIGELLIGVTGSILALLMSTVSIAAGVALLLSIYLIVFPLSMFLRSIIVDTLAFTGELVNEDEEEIQHYPRKETLGFKRGWNRMLLKNEAVIHKIILISFMKGEFMLGYELGEELIQRVLSGEIELEEAFDEVVYEHLGENSPKANLFRRMIKRFLGVYVRTQFHRCEEPVAVSATNVLLRGPLNDSRKWAIDVDSRSFLSDPSVMPETDVL